jgi:hypothetical protein
MPRRPEQAAQAVTAKVAQVFCSIEKRLVLVINRLTHFGQASYDPGNSLIHQPQSIGGA